MQSMLPFLFNSSFDVIPQQALGLVQMSEKTTKKGFWGQTISDVCPLSHPIKAIWPHVFVLPFVWPWPENNDQKWRLEHKLTYKSRTAPSGWAPVQSPVNTAWPIRFLTHKQESEKLFSFKKYLGVCYSSLLWQSKQVLNYDQNSILICFKSISIYLTLTS